MYHTRKWNISSRLWSKILYDYISAYEFLDNKEDVVESLKPLYFARAASFYRQTLDMTHQEAEDLIVRQARQFQRTRGYLLKRFKYSLN